jgi:hypothetical protein
MEWLEAMILKEGASSEYDWLEALFPAEEE